MAYCKLMKKDVDQDESKVKIDKACVTGAPGPFSKAYLLFVFENMCHEGRGEQIQAHFHSQLAELNNEISEVPYG